MSMKVGAYNLANPHKPPNIGPRIINSHIIPILLDHIMTVRKYSDITAVSTVNLPEHRALRARL